MRVVLTALFSERYPSSGESHALSVLAGQLRRDCVERLTRLEVLDMVALGRDALDDLACLIAEVRPDIVGISVTYGTYSKLLEIVPTLREILPPHCQLIYGGALATYLADDILRDVDPMGVVFIGEAEVAFAAFLNADLDRNTLQYIRNVAYIDEQGDLIKTARALTDAANLAIPSRNHLATLVPTGIQLYAEASRGCSWAHCTFCLRGLLDLKGEGAEYRRMPQERITGDFLIVKSLGGSSLTFADEDLLGGGIQCAAELVSTLEQAAENVGGGLNFDASATVHSIVSHRNPAQQEEREALIARLRRCGLRKIFLGVESGSASQLRRFAKGHSRQEAADAIQILRRQGVMVELGWIMFDPLCNLSEVRENLEFLLECDAVDATSFLFNELRLQRGTHFERLLDTYARRTGVRLIDGAFDSDTLSYNYRYADPDVAKVVTLTRTWSDRLRPIHYPLKNLTRYGAAGSIAKWLDEPRRILSQLRRGMCQLLLSEVRRALDQTPPLAEDSMDLLLRKMALSLLTWSEKLPPDLLRIELVRVLLDGADATVNP